MTRAGNARRPPASVAVVLASALFVFSQATLIPGVARAAAPCAPLTSVIACENSKPGSPNSEWDINGSGDSSIQGFSTDISVNKGDTVRFKIKSDATAYRLDIYRLGYYQGNGARKMATVSPSAVLPQVQPACSDDPLTGLHDCGNWADSASWAVPTTAVSGIYVARLVRTDNGGASHIVFVVRDDASSSDLLVQTSDTTWQAYNQYGDAPNKKRSLYGGINGRAVKVSYNRPFTTRGDVPDGRDFFFAHEYPMIRFLEANGYDVSYTTNIDSDRRGALIKNHKVFISSGHDEYWSGAQRAHVEAARDAGVSLAFFSGNSVYWKTRWEPSVAGPSTPYRTLVVYKETASNAKVDPSPEWTGTWRDPRFSPPSDGGRPENGLMGTLYKVNTGQFAIEVPEPEGKLRLWRNTSVAILAPGTKAVLAPNTLGYEWDEDEDNGFRPAGLVRLSSTTKNVTEYLYDYGNTVAPGVATHHLTLYRAPSGALVFGGGTVQWAWGLDGNHDGPTNSPDIRMQQATVNLFADMGAQPASLQSNLSIATRSVDTTPPTSTIVTPAAGSTFASGSTVTIAGVSTDVGGRVGGVEVSTDNGLSWHPAVGRTSWTYTWEVSGSGPTTLKVRTTDDSGNIESSPATRAVTVNCPCTIFGPSSVPKTADSNDSTPIELGVRFRADFDSWITGVRFYKAAANTGTHVANLWTNSGVKLATATFANETSSGWQEAIFPSPVNISANTTYVASYYAPNGRYSADAQFFKGVSQDRPPLHALKDGADGPNGVYRAQVGGGFPTQTYNGANYWVDVSLSTVAPPDNTAPVVLDKAPPPGASSIPANTTVRATFSEPVQPTTIGFTLRRPDNSGVPANVTYDGPSRTAVLTPSSPLDGGVTYTATVSGAKDTAGNTMAGPSTWSFTTAVPANPPGVCPCSIWDDSVVPTNRASTDPAGVELGVKFRVDKPGYIDAIRFYKGPGNTGSHTGSLWNSTGGRLATTSFGAESSEGWQQAFFSSPVAVSPGTTYVASYYAPSGRYAYDNGYFGTARSNPPLTALANGTEGSNGVYVYGPSAFPTQGSAGANYWVDVVFLAPVDTTPPTVTARSPGPDATSVPVSARVRATFSEPVSPSSIAFTLRDASNAQVPSSVTYDEASRTASLAPTAELAAGGRYTSTVSGATDQSGNALAAPVTWSFTTSGPGQCPCRIFETTSVPSTPANADASAVEVGVKFRSDVAGYIQGIRFYKGAGNTGTHTGNLWTRTGVLLASAVFTSETATGWQEVTLASPVAINANTTYVASYHAPVGRYAADTNFFADSAVNPPLRGLASGIDGPNGVYVYGSGGFPTQSYGSANYWVDVTFTTSAPADTTPPTVVSMSPVAGASSVPTSTSAQGTFGEDVDPATVSFTLRDPSNALVSGSVTYDAATRTSTLTPASALADATTYTATVSDAKDLAGNTMSPPVSWSFTTASSSPPAGTCPCTIWTDTATPTTPAVKDSKAVELGVKFRTSTNGYISGIRFYKGVGNTGTHVGKLWSSSGTLLASATFTAETSTGWQSVSFSSPVPVATNTTYIASYYAPNGAYAADNSYFSGTGVTRGPLTALASGVDGGNGVYRYGGGFPSSSFKSSNYWVDVRFSQTAP